MSIPPRRPVNRSAQPTPKEDDHRINSRIDAREVRLIDADGENRGVMPTRQALYMAEEAGLDLVEISPDAKPPVAKILDYGKFKFQEQKKAAEARKKQKVIEIKEIKMRPMIDDHDYDVKTARRAGGSSKKATRSRSPCASAAAKWRIRSSATSC